MKYFIHLLIYPENHLQLIHFFTEIVFTGLTICRTYRIAGLTESWEGLPNAQLKGDGGNGQAEPHSSIGHTSVLFLRNRKKNAVT